MTANLWKLFMVFCNPQVSTAIITHTTVCIQKENNSQNWRKRNGNVEHSGCSPRDGKVMLNIKIFMEGYFGKPFT